MLLLSIYRDSTTSFPTPHVLLNTLLPTTDSDIHETRRDTQSEEMILIEAYGRMHTSDGEMGQRMRMGGDRGSL